MPPLPYQLRCGLHSWRGDGMGSSRCLMGPGFLSQEIPQQSFCLQSLQIRTCPQEKPVPDNFVPPLSPGVRPEAGQGVPVLPEVGGEEPGRPATFHFLCPQNGFLGYRQHGAGASRQSRLQSPWAWQDVAQPGRNHRLLLSPRPLADDNSVKGPADSTCQLLSGWRQRETIILLFSKHFCIPGAALSTFSTQLILTPVL